MFEFLCAGVGIPELRFLVCGDGILKHEIESRIITNNLFLWGHGGAPVSGDDTEENATTMRNCARTLNWLKWQPLTRANASAAAAVSACIWITRKIIQGCSSGFPHKRRWRSLPRSQPQASWAETGRTLRFPAATQRSNASHTQHHSDIRPKECTLVQMKPARQPPPIM